MECCNADVTWACLKVPLNSHSVNIENPKQGKLYHTYIFNVPCASFCIRIMPLQNGSADQHQCIVGSMYCFIDTLGTVDECEM